MTQHLVQRGNNRSDIFRDEEDREFFLVVLRDLSARYQFDVHSYVLMSNHVHVIGTPQEAKAVSKTMQTLGSRYVRYFNRRHSRTGGLYEGRYRPTVIDSEVYWFTCMRYVELNPVRAGLVKDPKDYRWSSYRNNALGIKDTLVVAHPLYQSLGNSAAERQEKWRELCQEALRTDQLVEVRHRVQYGGVQGTPTLRVPGAPIDTSIRVRI